MKNNFNMTMRDTLLQNIYHSMKKNKKIFFVTADFGAPLLDQIRRNYKDRFINVGVAEANLINVCSGLASEGFDVFAFAIAPFITMRCYEQIRINLALLSTNKKINVNLIGVGAGVSYDISGPTHHCLEDLSIMTQLPNFDIFSPSDSFLVDKFFKCTIRDKNPKYLRFDSKFLKNLDFIKSDWKFDDGFRVLNSGESTCIIGTGFGSHLAKQFQINTSLNVGIVDFYFLKKFNKKKFNQLIKKYNKIITIEESFKDYGALENIIRIEIMKAKNHIAFQSFAFKNEYTFKIGDRNFIHSLHNMSLKNLLREIKI
jgi:transketolase